MSAHAASRDIMHAYRATFLRGLATVLPTVLTLWVVFATLDFMSVNIARPIADGIKERLVETDAGNEAVFRVWTELEFLRRPSVASAPEGASAAERARWEAAERERVKSGEELRKKALRAEIDRRFPGWAGFVLAVVAVFVVGFFTTSFLGSSLWALGEGWASRIPLIKNIYPGAKQMVGFFLSGDNEKSWQAVVSVQFPRPGLWSVGFLTSENIPEIEARAGERVRGVYLGTPASGHIVLARESEIVAVDMTVDEALKFLMSGGVIGRDPGRPRQVPLLPWQVPSDPAPPTST